MVPDEWFNHVNVQQTKMPAETELSPSASPRSYGGQEHSDRVSHRRQRFIEAGIELFGTVGYHSTTVRAVTAAASLSNRYFYESFPSMEELLMACYQQVTEQSRARIRRLIDESPKELEARARAGVGGFLEQMRNPLFARITQVEVLGVSAQVEAMYVRSIREFGRLITETMTSLGAPKKPIDKRQVEIIGVALAGAMATTGAMWMRSHYRDSIESVTDATVKIMLGTAREL